jgi:hypothetical protein
MATQCNIASGQNQKSTTFKQNKTPCGQKKTTSSKKPSSLKILQKRLVL